MHFSFRDQVFRQREGLPMGSSISGILAILFMDKLETIALSLHLVVNPYKRYVDDIYLQTTNEETADHFHDMKNNVQPNLKFEIEKTRNNIEWPVIVITRFSKSPYPRMAIVFFEFYKRPSKNPLFVHHQSAIPTKSKLSFIRNERM